MLSCRERISEARSICGGHRGGDHHPLHQGAAARAPLSRLELLDLGAKERSTVVRHAGIVSDHAPAVRQLAADDARKVRIEHRHVRPHAPRECFTRALNVEVDLVCGAFVRNKDKHREVDVLRGDGLAVQGTRSSGSSVCALTWTPALARLAKATARSRYRLHSGAKGSRHGKSEGWCRGDCLADSRAEERLRADEDDDVGHAVGQLREALAHRLRTGEGRARDGAEGGQPEEPRCARQRCLLLRGA